MPDLTEAQLGAALASVFPGGTNGVEESDVLRTLYRHLRRPTGA